MQLPVPATRKTKFEIDNLAFFTNSLHPDLIKYIEKYINPSMTYEELESVLTDLLSNYILISSSVWDDKNSITRTTRKLAGQYEDTKEIKNTLLHYFEEKYGIYKTLIPQDYLDYLIQNKKPDIYSFISYSLLLMPNLRYTEISKNINNLIRGVNAFWERIQGVRDPAIQFMLYLISEDTGGTGKGNFYTMIETWAKKHNIEIGSTKVSTNQFTSGIYHENILVWLNEVSKNVLNNWAGMNDMIDGKKYIIENKYKMPYESKVRSFIIASSNFRPQENNSRRIAYIEFGSTQLDPDTTRKVYKVTSESKVVGYIDFDYYADIFEKWLLSVPPYKSEGYSFGQGFEFNNYQVLKWSTELNNEEFYGLQYICQALNETTSQYSVNVIYKNLLDKRRNEWDFDKRSVLGPTSIDAILRKLHQRGLIKKISEAKNTKSVYYDLQDLINDKDAIVSSEYRLQNIDINSPNYLNARLVVKDILNTNWPDRHEFDTLFTEIDNQ